jgi:drug/metabolite transporter (DMT)-like permease
MNSRHIHPAVWMLCGALCFAVMGTLTYALGSRCDWLVIALVRAVFMFTTSVLMAKLQGVRLALWEPRTLWVRSLAGSVSLVCNFYAMTRLPLADVLTLTNTYPLWILVLSAILMGVRPTGAEVVGVVLGLLGVALIQQPHGTGDRLPVMIALFSSVSTAVAMLGLHRLRGLDARAIVAHFAGVASVLAVAWLLVRGAESIRPTVWTPTTIWMLAGLCVSGTFGQLCLTKAYSAGPPSEVSIVGLSQVVFAMGFDVALWGRRVTPASLLGFALVLGPTAWLTGRAQRRAGEVPEPRREVTGNGAPGR